jgi:hypothetical protein
MAAAAAAARAMVLAQVVMEAMAAAEQVAQLQQA